VTNEGEIELSFTIDPSAETDLFALERKTGEQGNYGQIALIRTGVGVVTYIDRDADPQISNSYRLYALNECDFKVVSSNVASNIVLTNEVVNDNIILKWNSYHDWLGSVSGYRLFIDMGNGFVEYNEIQPDDTTYTISVSDIIHSVATGDVCFMVTAAEGSNPHGVTGESSSNISCYEISETVTVPNLFTPDGDLKNDLFRPVVTFTPVNYHLVINDIQGRVVFDTKSYTESWDGTQNGTPLPQGVYVWTLRVKTLTAKNIYRTGTITLYRNR
jgi:gliding motility-associated-like protein